MADIRVVHPRFQARNLSVRPGGLLAAKLVLDGQLVKREKGAYPVQDDAGRASVVKLRGSIDPIPKVEVDGQLVEIAQRLAWYEYAWAAWPFVLVAIGGALGGLFGGAAAVGNLRIMRGNLSPTLKYALSFVVGVGAVLAYTLFAGLAVALLGNKH